MIPLRVLKESPFYDYLINEGKDEWLAEGIEKGRQEGRQEGQRELAADLLRLFISRRFPRVNVTRKIKLIRDAATLQQLCLEVGDLKDAAALRKRLEAAIKAQPPR